MKYKACFLILAVILLTGCTSSMSLATYQPVLEKRESNSTTLVVSPSELDLTKTESKGFTLWKVKTDFPTWVVQALKSELINAGYSVSDSQAAQKPCYFINIADFKLEEGKPSLEISVNQGEKEIFKKVYVTQRPMKTSLLKMSLGFEENFNKLFKRAFQDIYAQFVQDLNAELSPLEAPSLP